MTMVRSIGGQTIRGVILVCVWQWRLFLAVLVAFGDLQFK
jgi:hypothetical protein